LWFNLSPQTLKVNTKNILRLSDGKKLCYAEYGERGGEPVFLFHGNPGVRLSWGLYPDSPFLNNIRIIAPDRPGYGFTEYKKNALEKWPNDITELADHLKIKKFHLFAPSGGGPYALACAWKIPERLKSTGIFGSVGPYTKESVKGVNRPLKVLWNLANPLFFLVKLQNRIMARYARKNPEKLFKVIRDLELSDYDKQIAAKESIEKIFIEVFPESYRQNGIGSAYDVTLPKNWNIPLDQIKSKIILWNAEEDGLVGNMTKYLAGQLPNAELISIPEAGHMWIVEHIKEVLEKLMKL
jgi:pimeloyl-ACP methyl ester carboxylesterase